MLVNRKIFFKSLKRCLPEVEKGTNATLDGFDSFFFHDGFVSTYNARCAMSVPSFAEGFNCSLNATRFCNVISKLIGDDLELMVENWKVNITCGKFNATLPTQSSKIEPLLQALALNDIKFSPLPEEFMDAVCLCNIPKDKSAKRGLFFSNNQITSSDGGRCNVYTLSKKIPTFYLDLPEVKSLLKFGKPIEISSSKSRVHFRAEDGSVLSCATRNLKEFPIELINKWVSEKGTDLLQGKLPDGTKDSLARVCAASESSSFISCAIMTFSDKELEIRTAGADGMATELLPSEIEVDRKISFEIRPDSVEDLPDGEIGVRLSEVLGKFLFTLSCGTFKKCIFVKTSTK